MYNLYLLQNQQLIGFGRGLSEVGGGCRQNLHNNFGTTRAALSSYSERGDGSATGAITNATVTSATPARGGNCRRCRYLRRYFRLCMSCGCDV